MRKGTTGVVPFLIQMLNHLRPALVRLVRSGVYGAICKSLK